MKYGIGTQSKNVVYSSNPEEGFRRLSKAGFNCCDFSLNDYLKNIKIYKGEFNRFFDKSIDEIYDFFLPFKDGAKDAGIEINQMHMPYPIFVPGGDEEKNHYLWNIVAPKSMEVCNFFGCKNIVVHGLKLIDLLGSESVEWSETERFLDSIIPYAIDHGITICIENLYNSNKSGTRKVDGPCCDVNRNVERIDRINERYDAEVMGFCFDTGHANLVNIDFEHFITTLGHRLKVLHMHDNDGIGDLHQLPFVFTKTRENKSSTDWDGFIRGMKNIEFDQVLSFETAPVLTAFPDEMKDDCLRMIARTGEYFWDKINE